MRAEKRAPLRVVPAEGVSPPSLADVLRGVVAGESWADEALYDSLYPVVAAALQKVLHRPADYEDLVQSSFEQIVRTLYRPRAEPIENLAAWASTIAVRVALDAVRARVKDRNVFERETESLHLVEATPGPGPELERQIQARQELQWLQRQLADMSAEQAEVLVMHDVLGFELSEVAGSTDTTVAATQKRLSRAHLELRKRAEKRAKGGRG